MANPRYIYLEVKWGPVIPGMKNFITFDTMKEEIIEQDQDLPVEGDEVLEHETLNIRLPTE